MQRQIEAQERAHAIQLEELKREMVADVGMLQATHMQEMSIAHERALASATASAPSLQPPDLEPKVALHLVSTGLIRMKHSCALARASCRMASDGMRSIFKEIFSGLACADDACSLIQKQWQHEQQHWRQRHDIHVSGQILAESVEMLQQNQHQLGNEQLVEQQQHYHQTDGTHHGLSQHLDQHFHEQGQPSKLSSTENVSANDDKNVSSRNAPRHVRFMLADGPHEPGASPALPPPAKNTQSDGGAHPSCAITSHEERKPAGRNYQQEDDSLDESCGEGDCSLQSYLGNGGSQEVSADENYTTEVKFAQLWPPHHVSSLPPASLSTLNVMLQPHSPATIAGQLINQARGVSSNTPQVKSPSISSTMSPVNVSQIGSTTSTLAAPDQSCDDGGAEYEIHSRELYGEYIWIVQKTQANDDIGRIIQVIFFSNSVSLMPSTVMQLSTERVLSGR